MKNISLKNIAKVCEGELHNCPSDLLDKEATAVEIDSRIIIEGGVFIATRGEKVDGHSFIGQVAQKGALGVICEKAPEDVEIPYVLVKDSFEALKKLAKYYRSVLSIPIIGITGSVGKTSTKEFIAGTLAAKYRVCKTQGNFNNEVGMPLTLLTIRPEHEIAVIEMGISDFGEMSRLADIAKPDTCVITNIGECHLKKLIDRDGVLKAKTEILKYLGDGATVFVNGDDDKLITVGDLCDHKVLQYGLNDNNDIKAIDIESMGLRGSNATLVYGGRKIAVWVPLPGKHMIYNAMAAALIGTQYGLDDKLIKQGIESVKATSGRSNILETSEYIIIDDCYNANPVSVRAAIDLLDMADTRKVAILGDMFELGKNEEELHYNIGEYTAQRGIELLITIGELSSNTFEGAKASGMKAGENLYHFATVSEALESISMLLQKEDSILVKASHGMHFETIVEALNT